MPPLARALVGARILTMATTHPHDGRTEGPDAPWHRVASAMAWQGDTILAVGSDRAILTEAKRLGIDVEDLGGRIVLPGFVDAHMHFLHAGVKWMRPDLRGSASLSACLARLQDWLRMHPGTEPVTAEGWDESLWPEGRRLHRLDLDHAAAAAGQAGRAIVARRIDGHLAVANTAALPAIRARWDLDAKVDLQSGVLLEEPSLYLNEVLPLNPDSLDKAVGIACQLAHTHGVTAVGDYSQAPFRAALQRAAARGSLSVRVASSIYTQQLEEEAAAGFRTGRAGLGPKDGVQAISGHAGPVPGLHGGDAAVGGTSPFLKDGGLKVFLDGSLGAHTAALRHEYLDGGGGCGHLNWSADEVSALLTTAQARGIQVHAHAIGDAAIDQGLAAFALMAKHPGQKPELATAGGGTGLGGFEEGGPNPLRHRFEHYEIVHDEQMAATARLGLVSSSQPNFVGEWSAKGGMYEARLGARFQLNNRFRTMKDAGIPLAFGSDGMPFGPLVGIQAAVNHPMPGERLTPLEAVWHYTWMAAWSLHWEEALGSLEVGKKADLLVLEETDLKQPPGTWRIRETIVGGTTRHHRQSDTP